MSAWPPPSDSAASPPAPLDYAAAPLRRQIGLFGAVMLGLGSILGTGVFVGLPHAAALAGPWVLLAIVLAGGLAFCNAMSSAQLAAAHPVAGGTYEYGYRLLSPALGFTAGWTFLLAKSASAATSALGAAWYVVGWAGDRHRPDDAVSKIYSLVRNAPPQIFRAEGFIASDAFVATALAVTLVGLFVALTLVGIRRASLANMLIVSFTAGVLFLLVISCAPASLQRAAAVPSREPLWSHAPNVNDVLSAVAISFVAFAGFARLATLGEEVVEPARTIPRAVVLSLVVSFLIYLGVGLVLIGGDSARLQVSYGHSGGLVFGGPLNGLASLYDRRWLIPLLTVAALTAMLGVLLNLILGLSRVWLAMGRRGDMPRGLAHVGERSGTPVPATLLSGVLIALLVLVGDVRVTWSFSAFSVLIYYAITNLACLRLPVEHRRYPRSLAWAGLVSCLGLAWFVEVKVWAVGVGLIFVGLVWHRLRAGVRKGVLVPSTSAPRAG